MSHESWVQRNVESFTRRFSTEHDPQYTNNTWIHLLSQRVMEDISNKTYEEYSSEMKKRLHRIQSIAKKYDSSDINRVTTTFRVYLDPSTPFSVFCSTLRANADVIKWWRKQKSFHGKRMSFEPVISDVAKSDYSTVGFDVKISNQIIGRVCGYVSIRNQKPLFVIVNIQEEKVGRKNFQITKNLGGKQWFDYCLEELSPWFRQKGFRMAGRIMRPGFREIIWGHPNRGVSLRAFNASGMKTLANRFFSSRPRSKREPLHRIAPRKPIRQSKK